jgi:hypothetical protein
MNQKRRVAGRNCLALLSTSFLPDCCATSDDEDPAEFDHRYQQLSLQKKERKDTIMRVVMSRDFSLPVKEEADVLDVIKGFSSEFLINDTYLPVNVPCVYPLIQYKVKESNERSRKQSQDEEMKDPE